MHPADPLRRAEHRALIEYGSAVLNDISGFYTAPDAAAFGSRRAQLERRFGWLEARVLAAPWFDGDRFSLVDAAFGPVFRYFDVFDAIEDFGILAGKPKLARWRAALAARPSVRDAVGADYAGRLWKFLEGRNGHLSRLMVAEGCSAADRRLDRPPTAANGQAAGKRWLGSQRRKTKELSPKLASLTCRRIYPAQCSVVRCGGGRTAVERPAAATNAQLI